jgi:hypothetical protein
VTLAHALAVTSLDDPREPSGRGTSVVAQALTVRSVVLAAPTVAGAADRTTTESRGADAPVTRAWATARARPDAAMLPTTLLPDAAAPAASNGHGRSGLVEAAQAAPAAPASPSSKPSPARARPDARPMPATTKAASTPELAPRRGDAGANAVALRWRSPHARRVGEAAGNIADGHAPDVATEADAVAPKATRTAAPDAATPIVRDVDARRGSVAAVAPPSNPSSSDDDLSPGADQALPTNDALRSLPAYPVRLPPSDRVRFRVTRGDASGDGVLEWMLDQGRYRAALRVHGVGLPGLYWTSEGDAATGQGVLPRRMVAHRKGKPFATASFEAGTGKVSFSGARVEQPFVPGGQDRLSWMMQLAGVLEARAQPLKVGDRIVLYVVGPRGSAELWQLHVAGHETLTGDHGATPTVKLVREAQRLYDTEIELWLDPARHHLPARWRQQQRGVPRPPLEWERLPG